MPLYRIFMAALMSQDSKIIDVFICKLRRKLDEWGLEKAKIETVWGQGYMLVDEKMNSQRFAG